MFSPALAFRDNIPLSAVALKLVDDCKNVAPPEVVFKAPPESNAITPVSVAALKAVESILNVVISPDPIWIALTPPVPILIAPVLATTPISIVPSASTANPALFEVKLILPSVLTSQVLSVCIVKDDPLFKTYVCSSAYSVLSKIKTLSLISCPTIYNVKKIFFY